MTGREDLPVLEVDVVESRGGRFRKGPLGLSGRVGPTEINLSRSLDNSTPEPYPSNVDVFSGAR